MSDLHTNKTLVKNEFCNFKSFIEWLNKNFNSIMFIVWGVISFALMYIVSGFTMFIHSMRSVFIWVNPFTYYSTVYSKQYNTISVGGKIINYDKYKESYRHFREHGTAFEVSFYLIGATFFIEPTFFVLHKCISIILLGVCFLGTLAGSYFGIYLELSLYLEVTKQNQIQQKLGICERVGDWFKSKKSKLF